MRVAITPESVALARDLAGQVVSKVRGKNYTGIYAKDRFFHGYLGELLVAGWLAGERKWFDHKVATDGKAAGPDFVAIQKRTNLQMRLEIKTASSPTHRSLMFPLTQRMNFDAVIGVRLNLDESFGEIMGWLSRREAEALKATDMEYHGHKHKVRSCPFLNLNDPERLLLQLVEND